MQAKISRFRWLNQFITVTSLGLLILFLNTTIVRAQKTPSIFKTEIGDKSKSISANNLEYINSLEAEYKANEASDKGKAKILRNKPIHIGVEQIDNVFNDYRKKSRTRNDWIHYGDEARRIPWTAMEGC
jgi:hypothetical protein